MDITGEYQIMAPREQVWQALNDPDVLARCIPGCESMERVDDNEFSAKVASKIGPVKAKFSCKVRLSNLNPPASYTLTGEGQGGVAGFAQGSADVELSEESPQQTRLNYSAQLKIGGKLAQVGSRLVAGVTRKTADQFFANFAAEMNPDSDAGSSEAASGEQTS